MKKINVFISVILLSLVFAFLNIQAQEFIVEKIKGKVSVLRGTNENYEKVKTGQILNGSDLLVTEANSLIQLSRDGNRFLLKDNSALGLNFIKEISINDLVLTLTAEEVRGIPKNNSATAKSTAVYGTKIVNEKKPVFNDVVFGKKKLNGAKQLAENGYKESAVIVAKETYRKYPATVTMVDDRLYFADLLLELGLKNEALDEYSDIKNQQLNDSQLYLINHKIEEINISIAGD